MPTKHSHLGLEGLVTVGTSVRRSCRVSSKHQVKTFTSKSSTAWVQAQCLTSAMASVSLVLLCLLCLSLVFLMWEMSFLCLSGTISAIISKLRKHRHTRTKTQTQTHPQDITSYRSLYQARKRPSRILLVWCSRWEIGLSTCNGYHHLH